MKVSGVVARGLVADGRLRHPARHEPGTGTIAFDPIFAGLEEVGYAGFVGCEDHPAAGTEAGLGWMRAAVS